MNDPTVENLVELPRRVVKQPTPELNPGGDCGACVLAGISGLSVAEVHEKLTEKGQPISFGRNAMAEALRRLHYDFGRVVRWIDETPYWPPHRGQRAWGDPCWIQSSAWRDWLTMAFEAGYYALAQVAHTPSTGPEQFMTDHWVMYCGTRTKWDGPTGARNCGVHELLVSDSARSKSLEAWVDLHEHLKQRGGFEVFLAKPSETM